MTINEAKAALKSFFGYDSFRPMQAEIIQSVYEKKDTVVLMPTGGGKSICYQIPAVTTEGIAIVVSPLIALMKDQVEGLKANGIPAAFYNSSQSYSEQQRVEDDAIAGNLKILYVSPEKVVSQGFRPLLNRLNITLIAIDEAHCISHWGHDFRPEYTQLKFLKKQFPNVPLMALTATADKLTRKDILNNLGMQQPKVFISSFDRPNITLTVEPGQKRLQKIVAFLQERRGQSGIIYCLARKSCESLAEKLRDRGFVAEHYHAQLPSNKRAKVQEDFINDRIPIIVATIAFGMGIDKSNVRFVIHYNMPKNVESYYQEIGRAGRDGLTSEAILFYSYGDVANYQDMINQSEGEDSNKELKIAKLRRMFDYAESQLCRRKTILAYFDEAMSGNCGNCDVCKNPPKYFDGTIAAQKALSAVTRIKSELGGGVGINLLVDVLRGSNKREIFEKKLNSIKTYGAGRDLSFTDWQFLIGQMVHLGLLEVAYDEGHILRVTNQGNAVLFDGKSAQLVMPTTKAEQAQKEQMPVAKPKSDTTLFKDALFERLKMFRRQIGVDNGVPPYLIFSDVTLKEMAEQVPITPQRMSLISGVGEKKMKTYAPEFIAEIHKFIEEKIEANESIKFKGFSDFETYLLFGRGHSLEEIAEIKNRKVATIENHLATLFQEGLELNIRQFVSPEEVDIVQGALPLFEPPYKLSDLFEHFKESVSYSTIRFALAEIQRYQGMVGV